MRRVSVRWRGLPQPPADVTKRGLQPARLLGEFVLIFVGVVLALAADDWREGREQVALGERALRAMLTDLEADSAVLHELAISYAVDDSSATRLLRQIDNPAFPRGSIEELVRAFYLGAPYAPSRAAYTTALQTGALEFVRDEALRLAIVSYFEQSSSVFARNFEQLLAEVFELHDLLKPHLRVRVDSSTASSWPPPENARVLYSSWDALRRDNALTVQLLEFAIYSGYMVEFAQTRLHANLELQESIRRELGS